LEPTSQNAFPEGDAISIAAARSGSSDVKAVLANVSERLRSYADVHRTLQVPERQTYIDAAQYFRQLCISISRSKLESNNIRLGLAVRPLSMSSKRCWRPGLIVYELVTNSARHAFNGTGGEVWVELCPAGYFVERRVSDNGTTRERIQHGRGLTIVQQLVRCLRLEQSFGPQGSSSILVFPF
jgi:two-component sensor histidine kinase